MVKKKNDYDIHYKKSFFSSTLDAFLQITLSILLCISTYRRHIDKNLIVLCYKKRKKETQSTSITITAGMEMEP